MKRLLSSLLALAMVLAMLPASALAEEGEAPVPVELYGEVSFTHSEDEPSGVSSFGLRNTSWTTTTSAAWNSDVYEGYRAQLDDLSQGWYDDLLELVNQPATIVPMDATDSSGNTVQIDAMQYEIDIAGMTWANIAEVDITDALSALTADHPEYPWLATSSAMVNAQVGVTGGIVDAGGVVVLTIAEVSATIAEGTDDFSDAITTATDAIDAKLTTTSSDYDTLLAIHDYLAGHITYTTGTGDTDFYNQTAYSGLVDGKTVCAGYGTSFKLLCDSYGIPCVYVRGTGTDSNGDSENHGWNYVQLDDAWYAVDVTWDDTLGGDGANEPVYDYFLVGSDTEVDGRAFSTSHVSKPSWGGATQWPYPPLSTDAYAPPVTLGSVSLDQSAVTVNGADDVTVNATALDESNGAITSGVRWSVSPTTGGVSVNATTGEITVDAKAEADSYTITGTLGSVSKTATLTVTRAASVLTSVELTPATVTVDGATTQTVTAKALDQFGEEMTADLWQYETTSGSGVSIDGTSGVITVAADAVAANYMIIANYGATTANTTLTVERAASVPSSITITNAADSTNAASVTVQGKGTTAQTVALTAAATDQFGDSVDASAMDWTVTAAGLDTSLVTVAGGTITVDPLAQAGAYTITASLSGVTSNGFTLTVARAASALYEVKLSEDSVTVDGTNGATVTAKALNQFGEEMTTNIAWSVTPSDGGVSIGASTGVLTVSARAVAQSYTVTATDGGGTQENATLTVEREASKPVRLTLTDPGAVTVNGTLDTGSHTLTVAISNVLDQYDSSMSLTAADLTWTLTDPNGKVTVNDQGEVTIDPHAAAGTYTLTAEVKGVDGVSDTTTVTVERATPEVCALEFWRENGSAVLGTDADGNYTDVMGIPAGDTPFTSAYVLKGTDQFGDDISTTGAAVTNTDATGITADTSALTVTVNSSAAEDAYATITATQNGVTATLKVTAKKVVVDWSGVTLKNNGVITYGQTTASAFTLGAGSATAYTDAGEVTLNGTYSIQNGDGVLSAGAGQAVTVIFKVTTEGAYKDQEFTTSTFQVTVNPKTVTIDDSGLTISKEFDNTDELKSDGSGALTADNHIIGALAVNGLLTQDDGKVSVTFTAPAVFPSINYGTYAVTLTNVALTGDAAANYALSSDTYTFTRAKITKINPTTGHLNITLPAAPIIYDNTAKSATVTANATGLGTITVKYQKVVDSVAQAATTAAPVNAGAYNVVVSITEGTNFEATSTDLFCGSFTIEKAPRSLSMGTNSLFLYPGALSGKLVPDWSATDLDNSAAAAVTYEVTTGDAAALTLNARTDTVTAVKNASGIVVTVSIPETDNYNASNSVTATVDAVTQALASVTVSSSVPADDARLTAVLDGSKIIVSGGKTADATVTVIPTAAHPELTAAVVGDKVVVTLLNDPTVEVAAYTIDTDNVIEIAADSNVEVDAVTETASEVTGENAAAALTAVQDPATTVTGILASVTKGLHELGSSLAASQAAAIEADLGTADYTVEVKTTVKITAQALTMDGTTYSFVLKIEPFYTVTAIDNSNAGNTKELQDETKLPDSYLKTPVTVSVKLPAGFPTDDLFARHYFGDTAEGAHEILKVTVTSGVASWEQSTFSVVELLSDSRSGTLAITDFSGTTTTYEVDLTTVGASLPEMTLPGYTYGGWLIGSTVYTHVTDDLLTYLDGVGTTVSLNAADDVQLNPIPEDDPQPQQPSGDRVSEATYDIDVEAAAGGTVEANYSFATSGILVTLTVTPDKGYELDGLYVTDAKGNDIKVVDRGDGRFTFRMPARDVTVEAVFAEAEAPEAPCDGGRNCPSARFPDLDVTQWYHEATDFVIENGLMGDAGGGIFAPYQTTTRAIVVTILHRAEGKPAAAPASFTDVPPGEWYTEAVYWANANGIVLGWNNQFNPMDPITREQLATILWRYAQYKGIDVSVGESTSILSYADAASVSEYAIPAMQWACGAGVMGNGTLLNPLNTATRVEAAQTLYNFMKDEE